MNEPPDNKCGYTWPKGHKVGDDPNHQSCCYRDSVGDAGRCVWHVGAESTDIKTIEALQELRVDSEIRNQTRPVSKLLDGTILAGVELQDSNSFHRESLRNTNLSDADLRGADLTDADLRDADLTNADLRDVDLTNADLRDADLNDADLRSAEWSNAEDGTDNE